MNGALEPGARDEARVLIIDDSKTIRRTAETLLAKAGYQVMTAEDGF